MHYHRPGGHGGRGVGSILSALMIFRQLQQLGIFQPGRKLPLATLGLAASAFGLYFFEPEILRVLPFNLSEGAAAVIPAAVWYDPVRQWPRLFLVALRHGSETHLYYNLMSLLWKGVRLEDRWGTPRFAVTALGLTGASHAIMVMLSTLLYQFDSTRDWSDFHSRAVGMSALLFALKVIVHSDPALSGSSQAVAGGLFSVSVRYAAWAELLFVQLLMPGVSFLGHLSGIFAGLLYVWLLAPYEPLPPAWYGEVDGFDGPQPPWAPLLAPFNWFKNFFTAGGGERRAGGGGGGAPGGPRPVGRFNGGSYPVGRAAAPVPANGEGLRRRGGAAPAPAAARADAIFDASDDEDVQIVPPRPSAPPMPSTSASQQRPPSKVASGSDTAGGTSTAGGEGHGAAAAAPAGALVSGPPYYAAEMEQLRDMGLRDRRANLIALRAANGNVDQAVNALL